MYNLWPTRKKSGERTWYIFSCDQCRIISNVLVHMVYIKAVCHHIDFESRDALCPRISIRVSISGTAGFTVVQNVHTVLRTTYCYHSHCTMEMQAGWCKAVSWMTQVGQ